jgi:hypothetical protein
MPRTAYWPLQASPVLSDSDIYAWVAKTRSWHHGNHTASWQLLAQAILWWTQGTAPEGHTHHSLLHLILARLPPTQQFQWVKKYCKVIYEFNSYKIYDIRTKLYRGMKLIQHKRGPTCGWDNLCTRTSTTHIHCLLLTGYSNYTTGEPALQIASILAAM